MKSSEAFARLEPFDAALQEFYGTQGNLRRYRRLVSLGAEIGDPLAQYATATWYLHGQPQLRIARNRKIGIKWLMRAATHLNRAQYDLGLHFATGDGVLTNPRRAYELFSSSAETGSVAALEALITCLRDGFGTRKDVKRATRLQRKMNAITRKLNLLKVGRNVSVE